MKHTIEQLGQKLDQKIFDALMVSLNQTSLVSITDNKGTIVYANEKFVEVSKYSLNELIGQNHRILKSGHQPDELFTELWKIISSGQVWRGEIKNRAKDGSYYWVDTSIAPILNDAGKPERYIAIRFLISDKKKIEEDLYHQMEQLKKMNSLMVGRELRVIELKEQIKKLSENTNN